MNSVAIEVKGLSHRYKGQAEDVIPNMSLSVAQGQSFGLFGPNGTGKTTLISLITGLLDYQKGSIQLFDKEVVSHKKAVRRQFGYVPQSLSYYEELSPRHNLQYFGAMMGMTTSQIKERTEELLTVLGLIHVMNKPVKTFSGGMKRRVNLAIGVIHNPQLIFLDEPTVGVDVQTRHAIIAYLKELNTRGTTLFYTSHHLSEAQELCDTVALMDDGQIVAHDKLSNLLKNHQEEGLEGLFLKLTGKAFRD
jgi:ABC-2 type transport system ATP-binding protein